MNPQMQTEAHPERSTYSKLALSETDLLAGWGFDPHKSPRCSGCGSGTRTAGVIAPRWCATWSFSACWFTAANSNCNILGNRSRTHLDTQMNMTLCGERGC